MLKNFFLVVICLIFLNSKSLSKTNVFISVTIDDEIITNHDIKDEADYLKILNPDLDKLNSEKILNISKNSLIREIIKKKEIEKIIDLDQENPFVKDYLENLYKRLNFNNESDFNDYLKKNSNYTTQQIKEKLKIEIAWNELIYFKYSYQLKIDKEKLKKKVNDLKDISRKEYNLSEIVFKNDKNESLESLEKKIKLSISEIGFGNTANIFSISDSSKFGGKIGWVDENNLSKLISKKLINVQEEQITDLIQIGNNFLILKVEKIRQKNISINKDDELKEMIKFETNRQLNQFSKIFFDKSKINYSINEK